MAKNYSEAVAEAIQRMEDVAERGEEAIVSDAVAYIDSLMTPEERAESKRRVALISKNRK